MVSVVIPVYNGEKYIEQAIRSVMAQATREELEVIVADDASTDGTKETVARCMEQYQSLSYCVNDRNLGVAETRNVGMRAAKGEYLAFLDADDWWAENKLEKQLELIKNKNASLVYTGRELMKADGSPTGKIVCVPEAVTYDALLCTNCIPCSSVLMKTNVAREFYMCHDELHEDYIMWLRILRRYGKAYGINEPLLKSRLAEGGKSRNKLKSAKMHYGVYRYLGISRWKAWKLFVCYAVNGIKKYR